MPIKLFIIYATILMLVTTLVLVNSRGNWKKALKWAFIVALFPFAVQLIGYFAIGPRIQFEIKEYIPIAESFPQEVFNFILFGLFLPIFCLLTTLTLYKGFFYKN